MKGVARHAIGARLGGMPKGACCESGLTMPNHSAADVDVRLWYPLTKPCLGVLWGVGFLLALFDREGSIRPLGDWAIRTSVSVVFVKFPGERWRLMPPSTAAKIAKLKP